MKKEITFQGLADFKKKLALNEKLKLDDRDNTILAMLQKDPHVSQQEIAKKVGLSQPSVGARIRKLEEKGIIQTVTGVNFRIVDLRIAKVEVSSTDTTEIIKEFKDCPFFLNALIMSGRYNLCLFFMAPDLKRLEGIVNYHLRGNEKVKDMEMNVVISSAKDLVLPLNIDYENPDQVCCDQKCQHCFDA